VIDELVVKKQATKIEDKKTTPQNNHHELLEKHMQNKHTT
jgi:hypothetical protein